MSGRGPSPGDVAARRTRLDVRDVLRLLRLATMQLAGRRFWILALLPIAWPLLQVLFLLGGMRENDFVPEEVVPSLIGLPIAVLGAGLGVRVIAAEIEQRTIEIAYTVPGGASRLWAFKLVGGALILGAATLVSALVVHVFLVETAIDSVFASLLAGWFHLALAAWLAALTRSEVTGALACVPVIIFGILLSSTRPSPFFNAVALRASDDYAASDVLAWTVQARLFVVLATAAFVALAIGRAERREKILA